MPRSTNAPASRKRRRRRLALARGFRGARSKHFRQATESVHHAMQNAYAHRKTRKRDFRSLWIVRISAACRSHGLTYHRLIEGLTKARVRLNRKMLAEIAVRDPNGFSQVVERARAALA